MVRLKSIIHVVVFSVLAASVAQAASTITVIGRHPFYRPPLESVDDLNTMMRERAGEVEDGLAKAGYPQLVQPLREQYPNADIREVAYPHGTTFEWMLFKSSGRGPVKVAPEITWGGDGTVPAYEFAIDKGSSRFVFGVPHQCGNLALLRVEGGTQKEQEPEPVAKKEITCNDCPSECRDNPEKCPPECEQLNCYGGVSPWRLVADIGYMHLLDPGDFIFGRIGAEYSVNENFSLLGMVGGAYQTGGPDGEDAWLIDFIAQYSWSNWFVGLGLGGWLSEGNDDLDSEDTDLDVIANIGARVYGEPDDFNVSLFVEGRSAVDEFDDMDLYGRVGAGLRFRW